MTCFELQGSLYASKRHYAIRPSLVYIEKRSCVCVCALVFSPPKLQVVVTSNLSRSFSTLSEFHKSFDNNKMISFGY